MKIAVTGGLGFIGTAVVKELLKYGHDVVIIDIRHDKAPPKTNLRVADITNFEQIKHALSGVDVVYHLAGTVLNSSRKNPYDTTHIDVLGTINVLEASIKNGAKKVIYASSFYVYDGFPSALQVFEGQHSDIFKAEMFGVVKLVGERLIHEYNNRKNLEYVILRYGPVYGPNNRCSSVIYEFIESGLRGDPLVVWGLGKRRNQYTYVEDIARGSVAALQFQNETFNLISPEQLTIRQVAELLAKKFGFKVRYDLNKPEGSSLPYISPKKAMDLLEWKPRSLEEGVDNTIKILETYNLPQLSRK